MSLRVPTATFGPQSVAGELALWGNDPTSNIRVTEATSLGLSAFWAGVTIISEAMASMPITVWRIRKGGGKDRADQHPAQYCLDKTTNGWQTPSTFKSFTQGCLLMSGNSVAEIVRNGRGQCTELRHWLPRNTMYGVDGRGFPMYGVMGSAYQSAALPIVDYRNYEIPKPEWFPCEEVCHFSGFGTDGYLGLSTLAVARSSLSLGLTIEQFADRFFTSGRPTGFLSKDGNLSKDQRDVIRQEWKELHEGVRNALNVGVLSNGMTWQQMGFSSNDAQFLQTRAFQLTEVCRWLRISPHMLGDLSQVTEANIEQLMLQFITYTLLPWMTRWCEQMNLKLFTPMEQFTYYTEFDIEAFLAGDRVSKAKADTENIRNGTRTPQECRDRDGFNKYEDGSGAVPLAMASQLSSLKMTEDGTSPLQKGPASSEDSASDSDTPKKEKAPKSKTSTSA